MKKFLYSFIAIFCLVLLACDTTLKVKFDSAGGSEVADIYVDETIGTIEKPEDPVRQGYLFLGWYFNDQEFDFSTPIVKSITLKAKWAEGISIILKNVNDETEIFVPKNQSYELPTPERNGFFFKGWEDASSGEIIDSEYIFTEDMYLKAVWEKKDTYSIYYIYNSETLKNDLFYEGDEYTPYEHELLGYTFAGWYTDEELTKPADFNNLSRVNNLYAKMNPNIYTISFSHSTKTIKAVYGQRIGTLPSVSVSNCSFKGWEYNGKLITNLTTYMFAEDITLNAVLYTNTTFILEGTSGTKVNYKIGDITPYVNAQKEGFIFAGWYTNDSFLGDPIYVIDSEEYANKVLYAKWVASDDENNTYSSKIVEQIKAYYTKQFANTNIYENINFEDSDPFYGSTLTWTSSNTNSILADGKVVRGKTDVAVDLTLQITYGKVSETLEIKVNVKGAPYQDLSEESVVGAYVYSGTYYGRPVDDILLNTANVIYLAFVTPREDGTLVIASDVVSKYNSFKEAAFEKGVRVIASIGGANSTVFDTIATNDISRRTFVESCLEIVKEYGFAGIDVDWEYPTDSHKTYYTLLMKDLYEMLKEYDKELLVTSAIPAGPFSHSKFDLKNSVQYLDYINMMSYDLQCSNVGGKAYHHSALYQSSMTYQMCSIDATLKYWKSNYGIPYDKVVIGAAFYGRMSTLTKYGGVIASEGECGSSIRYSTIVSEYLSKSTVSTYWDNTAKAPYLFDTATKTFISYDNAESIKYKCDYVKSSGVAGIFWWDYGSDSTGELIEAVNSKLSVLE